ADDLTLFAAEFGRTDCPHDELYYFHNDHLGTPQRITNQTGTIVWSANYKPFGEAIITTRAISNPFRFPGQYYDQETGLHFNYFRYYEPRIGRYLRGDPLNKLCPDLSRTLLLGNGFSEQPFLYPIMTPKSHYIYVLNNPVINIDLKALEVFILGRTPYFYRIPILRKLVRVVPKSVPQETSIDSRFVPRPAPIGRQLGLPREDLWWQQDPFPPEPRPYNPNNPEFLPSIKRIEQSKECEENKNFNLPLQGNRKFPFDEVFNPIGFL
ncbi:MAG: hypothetical protein DRG83_19210, partial [Deltaproteobacteria bacterium]